MNNKSRKDKIKRLKIKRVGIYEMLEIDDSVGDDLLIELGLKINEIIDKLNEK
jgi:hypothetical protein